MIKKKLDSRRGKKKLNVNALKAVKYYPNKILKKKQNLVQKNRNNREDCKLKQPMNLVISCFVRIKKGN
jgi:hypothetical protein